MNKICFVLDTHYPNYVNRLKKNILKQYVDFGLQEKGIGFIITTNLPEEFNEYKNLGVNVYNIDEIRSENSSLFESLPLDPTGIYPSKFPWNLERFGLLKAGELGYNVVVNLDSDVVFNNEWDAKNFDSLISNLFEENIVVTNQALFKYEKDSQNEVFYLHNKYLTHFNLEFKEDELNSMDGPVIIYMGKSSEDIIRFAKKWDMLTDFGYKKEFGFGYEGIVCGNWSLCIPMSEFKLKWKSLPLTPIHNYSDRY
jgi:hypothetical protein